MKNLLAVDTSTTRASVALYSAEQFFTLENNNIKQHADCLLPMISELLAGSGISLCDLDGIVYGCGPGSFTGIRVSCSVVKAFAYAHDLPVYPVSSLQALAFSAYADKPGADNQILSMLDARMQEVYWEYFTDMQGSGAEVSSVQDIKSSQADKLIICGPNLNEFLSKLPSMLRDKDYIYKDVYPTAESMLRLVQAGFVQPVDANSAVPMYVRNKVVRGAAGG